MCFIRCFIIQRPVLSGLGNERKTKKCPGKMNGKQCLKHSQKTLNMFFLQITGKDISSISLEAKFKELSYDSRFSLSLICTGNDVFIIPNLFPFSIIPIVYYLLDSVQRYNIWFLLNLIYVYIFSC